MSRQIILMDKERIQRSLKRIAIQIFEEFPDRDLVMIGLNERGYAMASCLKTFLSQMGEGGNITLCQYEVKDLARNKALPNCAEKKVLIVDDVIFSGKTMFDALTAVCSTGDPEIVQIVSLIDRGHRRYPLTAGLVGISVPTKLGEHIEVMLKDETPEQVILFKN